METKICFKCGIEKPISDYYKHKQMGDGHLNKCKDCTKKDTMKDYNKNIVNPEWKEKEQSRGRDKYRRLYVGTGKASKERIIRYEAKYPEKVAAKNHCTSLVKPFTLAEKHHWSYNDEHFKDVIWITKQHHMKAHRFLIYDQERKMYRRYDNNILLDTKEAHATFITHCIQNLPD